ncbi:MAG: stage III sporulation protein AF [Oscillospiraceae bacterium]|nr:stage III sporulation protein AF [Oscillospiraceae bacterium]MCI9548940.1 stage III sporulation protein AF [Oscillospiraceae bacterium]
MMGFVRSWLLGVTAAALVLALAEALAPEGSVKKVCRLAGGMALLLAAAGPVLEALDGNLLAGAVEGWRDRSQRYERELEENNERLYLAIIEEETAAYVMDKARELGFECAAEVTCGYDENGVPCPWEVAARGQWTPEQRARLERLLEEELGVPAQRQYYEEILP